MSRNLLARFDIPHNGRLRLIDAHHPSGCGVTHVVYGNDGNILGVAFEAPFQCQRIVLKTEYRRALRMKDKLRRGRTRM
jgi:hypothetical protein